MLASKKIILLASILLVLIIHKDDLSRFTILTIDHRFEVKQSDFLSIDPRNLNFNPYTSINNSPLNYVDLTGKAPLSAVDILVGQFGNERAQQYGKLDRLLNRGRFGRIFPERFQAFQNYSGHVWNAMHKSLPDEISKRFLDNVAVEYKSVFNKIIWEQHNPSDITGKYVGKVNSLKTQSYEKYLNKDLRDQIQQYVNDREFDFWESANENMNLDFYEGPRFSPPLYQWYGEEYYALYSNEQFTHVNELRGYFNSLDTESIIEEYGLNHRIYELPNSKVLSYLHTKDHLEAHWLGRNGRFFKRPYLHFVKP